MKKHSDQILVADDDDAIRGVVVEVLIDAGYEIVEAVNGNDALALFKENAYRVVITDIRMPGLDGISLLEEIRKIDEQAQVIIMTSHASMETSVKALKLGAYDYILKPFDDVYVISQVTKRALDAVMLVEERDLLVATLQQNNQELERMNKFFRELAIRDGLTGLYNHRHFQELLKIEVERARRYERDLSVVFIDVDHFKQYNDTHGHQQGDELLKELARLMETSIRTVDTAARWGGEEFVILVPETSANGCLTVAEKFRRCVADYAFKGGETQPGGCITVSAGIATLKPEGNDHTLVGRADKALYEAKHSGRNAVYAASD